MNTNNPTGPTGSDSDGGGWFDDFAPLTDQANLDESASGSADRQTSDDAGIESPASGDALEAADTLSAVSSSVPGPPSGPGEADTDTFAALTPDMSGWEWIAPEQPAQATDSDTSRWPADTTDLSTSEQVEPTSTDVFPLSVGSLPTRPPRHRRALRGYVIAGALLALVLVLAGVGAFVALSGGGDAPAVAEPSTSPAIVAPAPAADADCPNRTDGAVTTGRDAGGTFSGPAAIKAFEYAYFVERSGDKARQVVAPLARVPSAQEIQVGIDTRVPPGTGHCLTITDRSGGLWGVELTMLPPAGGEPEVLRQLISTAVVDGRTVITAITKDTTQ